MIVAHPLPRDIIVFWYLPVPYAHLHGLSRVCHYTHLLLLFHTCGRGLVTLRPVHLEELSFQSRTSPTNLEWPDFHLPCPLLPFLSSPISTIHLTTAQMQDSEPHAMFSHEDSSFIAASPESGISHISTTGAFQ